MTEPHHPHTGAGDRVVWAGVGQDPEWEVGAAAAAAASLTCSSADLVSLTKQQVQQDILTNKYLHYCLIRNSKTYRFLKQFSPL